VQPAGAPDSLLSLARVAGTVLLIDAARALADFFQDPAAGYCHGCDRDLRRLPHADCCVVGRVRRMIAALEAHPPVLKAAATAAAPQITPTDVEVAVWSGKPAEPMSVSEAEEFWADGFDARRPLVEGLPERDIVLDPVAHPTAVELA